MSVSGPILIDHPDIPAALCQLFQPLILLSHISKIPPFSPQKTQFQLEMLQMFEAKSPKIPSFHLVGRHVGASYTASTLNCEITEAAEGLSPLYTHYHGAFLLTQISLATSPHDVILRWAMSAAFTTAFPRSRLLWGSGRSERVQLYGGKTLLNKATGSAAARCLWSVSVHGNAEACWADRGEQALLVETLRRPRKTSGREAQRCLHLHFRLQTFIWCSAAFKKSAGTGEASACHSQQDTLHCGHWSLRSLMSF